MTSEISSILKTMGIGTQSAQASGFNPETIRQPVKLSRNKNVVPDMTYEDPTPSDIGHFREITGMTSGAICRMFCVDRRWTNLHISEKGYEKGARLPKSIWASMLESAELIEPLRLKPKMADIREEVLRSSQVLPTKHELFLAFGLSGLTMEQASEKTGISLETLQHNVIRGQVIFDDENNYVENDAPNALSKINTSVCSLTREEWSTLREALGATSLNFIMMPPRIRAACLSRNTDPAFSTSKQKDKADNADNEELAALAATIAERPKDIDLAEYDYDDSTPYFVESNALFVQPEPHELRMICTWTGLSLRELASLMDIKERDIKFLMSHYAVDHVSVDRRTGRESKPKTKYIRYYQWRRLLEVFGLVSQEKLHRIK